MVGPLADPELGRLCLNYTVLLSRPSPQISSFYLHTNRSGHIPFLVIVSLDCFAFTVYDGTFLTQVQPSFGVKKN
jgi:hypothetical protein